MFRPNEGTFIIFTLDVPVHLWIEGKDAQIALGGGKSCFFYEKPVQKGQN